MASINLPLRGDTIVELDFEGECGFLFTPMASECSDRPATRGVGGGGEAWPPKTFSSIAKGCTAPAFWALDILGVPEAKLDDFSMGYISVTWRTG